MQLIGLVRLGRDAEIRTVVAQRGEPQPVTNLSLAYNVWVKGEKVTQWLDAALWGKRAETLLPYLKKGAMLCVTVDSVRLESFNKKDGTMGTKLTGMVTSVDLAGGAPVPAAAPAPMSSVDDENIPF
jgi:single-strand DNA-binding protein